MPNTYFVSGHLDLTKEEFESYYKPQFDEALEDDTSSFVVGDARGADCMAQEFLRTRSANVTVYHMHSFPRNCAGPFAKKGGFPKDSERDITMTRESTHDIGWVREGREDSGTARNLARRLKPVRANRYGNETKR